jgi:fatty-acid peroxygenase
VPRERTVDSSRAFLREGFEFITNRCRRFGTDAFETRLMFRPALCMQGADAARFFYSAPLTRRGALPWPVLTLLQDFGSVATLDGAAHRRRKQMFLQMMSPEALRRLDELSTEEWRLAVERWRRADHVVLLAATEELLCRVACRWAGVPLGEPEAQRRTAEFAAMIDGAGSAGLRNVRGQMRRRSTERWAAAVIGDVRAGNVEAPADRAVSIIAAHHEDGGLLDERVAAVELLNVLRPIVATARFVVFAAVALHDQPGLRSELSSSPDLLEPFVQEVRRFYPFFPAIGGRAVAATEWRGHPIPRGHRVLLDLYGTNRDPGVWEAPEEFRVERFVDWPGDPFTFIPQGGGDHLAGHRCPGEWVTIALVKSAIRALTGLVTYTVPPQDLRIRPSRLPPLPQSGFVIRDVAESASEAMSSRS